MMWLVMTSLALLLGCGACTEEGLGVYFPPPPWAWACAPPAATPTLSAVRGVNLIGFDAREYLGPDARVSQSVQEFADLGGNWLAIDFWWFQETPASVEITPAPELYTIPDEAIEVAVQAAHANRLSVVLRPMVDLPDGTSRRFIQPSTAWFASYRDFILRYADLAARWHLGAFSVGVELAATEGAEGGWRDLIDAVRVAYSGTLVYCATYDTASRLRWWDAVDVIGIDAYYSISPWLGADTSDRCAWVYWLDVIHRHLAEVHPGQPVWLTEVGVRSARGAARLPWCFTDPCFGLVDGDAVDYAGQAEYYRALLQAADNRPWLQGIFWWAWNADPRQLRPTDFTPQGKPAQDVLAQFWGGAQ
jgi:hypothetical protein